MSPALPPQPIAAAYASPSGSAQGAGTLASPWNLATALASPYVGEGTALYLRGGTYTGDFTATISGATVQTYQDEMPVINGSLRIEGAGTTWQDLEMRYDGWTTRASAQSGSNPTDIPTGKTVGVYGPGTILRRCRIHDVAGFGVWSQAPGALVEDCLVYNQGWQGPDRGHGHGIYTQSQGGATFRRCCFVVGYGYSIHAYGSDDAYLLDLTFEDCVALGGQGALIGGYTPVNGATVAGLHLYDQELQLGYGSDVANGSAVLSGIRYGGTSTRDVLGMWTALSETDAITEPINEVRVLGSAPWQTVVVHNAAGAETIAAPVAGIYRNALNWAETIQLETGDNLPLTGWTVATPTGASDPLYDHPGPAFNCFIVEL